MNYICYPYNLNYQDALAQDIRNWAFKLFMSKLIVASVPYQNRRFIEGICDGTSGFIDFINPPKTPLGQMLALGTNAYNLSKYL